MSTQVFDTRISLKYDQYSAWVENNPVLLQGEVAVTVVPASTGAATNEPCLLLKIGDGTKTFNQLPYVSGLSADNYQWSKAASKPSYTASEISGLDTYISGHVQDTDTVYQCIADDSDGHKFYLQSKPKNGSVWTTVSTITIPDNNTTYNLGSFGVTATSAELNVLDGITTSTAELNYIDGVTSNVQTQLNSKAASDHNHSGTYATAAQGSLADNAMPKAGGTFTGNVAMGSGKTLSVNTPSSDGHAATKKYVDDSVAGLSGAMHFRGTSTTVPTASGGATISGITSYNAGDVVIYGNKEYVYTATSAGNTNTSWKELGDESSFALKTTTINGKALSGNISLTASDIGAATSANITSAIQALDVTDAAVDNKYVSAVSETDGKISVTRATLPAETNLSKVDSGSGNVVTSIGVSGHAITVTKGITALTSHQSIKTVSTDNTTSQTPTADESIAGTGTIELHKIAKTANVNDLIQTSGDTLILNCGSAVINFDNIAF